VDEFLYKLEKNKQQVIADLLRRERINPEDDGFVERLDTMIAGEIDPSIARHIPLDVYDDNEEPNLQGVYSYPDNDEVLNIYNIGQKIRINPGDLATLHTSNTPETWAHEYRHKNYGSTETTNRKIDVFAADTDYGIDAGLRSMANSFNNKIPSDALGMIPDLWYGALDVIQKEIARKNPELDSTEQARTVNQLKYNSKAWRFYEDALALEAWERDLAKRNEARKNGEAETIADFIRQLWSD
tara:strand:+ start:5515 stop:6240 length:726 start_codon:yes stop_codon:yes gene_type:complete